MKSQDNVWHSHIQSPNRINSASTMQETKLPHMQYNLHCTFNTKLAIYKTRARDKLVQFVHSNISAVIDRNCIFVFDTF